MADAESPEEQPRPPATPRTDVLAALLDGDDLERIHALIGNGIDDGLHQSLSGNLISFPETGGTFAFPAGQGQGSRHVIDLERGYVDSDGVGSFEMDQSLDDLHTDMAHAALLWADQDLTFFMYDRDDEQTGVFEYDQSSYMALDAIRAAKLRIDAPVPFMFRAQFSAGLETPLRSTAVSTHQERFGRVQTSDQDFTSGSTARVQWVGVNAADYQEADLPTAADTFGDPTIWTSNVGQHVFILAEVSGNDDAEIQVREWQIDGQQRAADNDIMGSVALTNTNVVTVSSNDFVVLESDINTAFKEIVVQSAGGGEVDVRAQYRGYAPGIRR